MAYIGTPQALTVLPKGPDAAPPVLPEAHATGADPLLLSGTVGAARADELDTAFPQ
ncbi:hypothetical protein ACFZDI_10910 [Streptomyces sp. NPDC007907]|uniref:hypothetical protein n=1 Tax=Streptomyces sp. NPDC007907 TaxID=3364789 RepID=UPI0036EEDD9D